MQINLSESALCGIGRWGGGTYTADGIKAIAESISVSSSVTSIDVGNNNIGKAASLELLAAMKGKNMVTIGMAGCSLGVEGSKVVAEMISVMASLTSINLSYNNLAADYGRDMTGIKAIADALVEASITSVGKDGLNLKDNYFGPEGWGAIFAAICSSQVSKITSIDASGEEIGPAGAKLIGQALGNSVNPSLTYLW